MEAEWKEKLSVIKTYLENPYCDDADLYYNGLCYPSEFRDHKPNLCFKMNAALSVLSKLKIQLEEQLSVEESQPNLYKKLKVSLAVLCYMMKQIEELSIEEPRPFLPADKVAAALLPSELDHCFASKFRGDNRTFIIPRKARSKRKRRFVDEGEEDGTTWATNWNSMAYQCRDEPLEVEGDDSVFSVKSSENISNTLIIPEKPKSKKRNREKEEEDGTKRAKKWKTMAYQCHDEPLEFEGDDSFFSVKSTENISTTLIIPQKPKSKKHPREEGEEDGATRVKKCKTMAYQCHDEPLEFEGDGDSCFSVQSSETSSTVIIPQKPKSKKRPREKDEKACSGARDGGKIEELQNHHEPLVLKNSIPAKLKTHMENEDAVLVIEKTLTKTDVGRTQNRLSMPLSKIRNLSFLTEEEHKMAYDKNGVHVRLIEPSGNECDMKLRRWEMNGSVTLNLLSSWIGVVNRNNLRENTPIKVYSFKEGPQLYCAIIKVQP